MVEFYKGFLKILIVTVFCGHKRYILLMPSNIIILFIVIVPTFISIVHFPPMPVFLTDFHKFSSVI